ncbi:hypothetical protein WDU94_004648 [Cyamophila willieti]
MCKSLIMLRDTNISGRLNLLDIPLIMHMLQFWRVGILDTSSCPRKLRFANKKICFPMAGVRTRNDRNL